LNSHLSLVQLPPNIHLMFSFPTRRSSDLISANSVVESVEDRERQLKVAIGNEADKKAADLPVIETEKKKNQRRQNPCGEFSLQGDRKSTRLNSSHGSISYAVFCLK